MNFQMDPIEAIFHEKQEGSLCAQHCLNTLLQGSYFSPVDLAEIARQMDDCERERMAEGGTQSDEYLQFIEQPSSNFDDSGFFSVQVISSALRVWNLDIVPFNSQDPVAVAARSNPMHQKAFICNFHEHWFTIRKVGSQWFNLNSLLMGPELVSDTYLSLFLTQLQQEGYSIFILIGDLPFCDADDVLKSILVTQTTKPRLINEKSKSSLPSDNDADIQQALAESRAFNEHDDKVLQKTLSMSRSVEEEAILRHALEMSMRDNPGTSTDSTYLTTATPHTPHSSFASHNLPAVDLAQLRELRLSHFTRNQQESQQSSTHIVHAPSTQSVNSTEEEMLKEAMRLSMEQP